MIDHFREHGWARLGKVIDPAPLRERAGEIMQRGGDFFFQHDSASGRYEDVPRGRGWEGPSPRYRKIEKLERDPIFLAAILDQGFVEVAREIVGAEVSLCRAVLFTKAANGGTELPWHQDGGSFWGLSQDPVLQIWTALDDAPEVSGCLELIPGSHKHGLATPLGGVIPDDVVARNQMPRVKVPARAGESLLLHNYVWHRSGTNATAQARRALTICYMDAATRCTRRRSPRSFLRVC